MRASSAIQVINVAGWLQNSVQPERTFLLPLSLVWLSHAVIYCLSLGCLMVDANWPPFPLSSAQMKRFPPSCDGACHNLIRQIKKLTAVTLSSFEALASSAIMIFFSFFFFAFTETTAERCQTQYLTGHAAAAELYVWHIWMFVICEVFYTVNLELSFNPCMSFFSLYREWSSSSCVLSLHFLH